MDVFDELLDGFFSPQAQAQREAELRQLAQAAERERYAACELLRQRGHEGAALIVAASSWRSDCVDNWDGGQYEVELAVPAALYDAACDNAVLTEISAAVEAVIGVKHFRSVNVTLQQGDPPSGWDAAMAQEIIDAARARQSPLPEIGSASG